MTVTDGAKLTIKEEREKQAALSHIFSFHRVLETDVLQEEVYREVAGGISSHAFKGFNACGT